VSVAPSGSDETEDRERTIESLRRENAALKEQRAALERSGIILGGNPFHLRNMGRGRTTREDYLGKPAAARPSIGAAGLGHSVDTVLRGMPFEACCSFPTEKSWAAYS
jgi:hypothetical protein